MNSVMCAQQLPPETEQCLSVAMSLLQHSSSASVTLSRACHACARAQLRLPTRSFLHHGQRLHSEQILEEVMLPTRALEDGHTPQQVAVGAVALLTREFNAPVPCWDARCTLCLHTCAKWTLSHHALRSLVLNC